MPSRPLHLLIVSNTESANYIQGGDRDWVNLLNALGPEHVRVTWAGITDTEFLHKHFDERLTTRFIDLHFKPFYELLHQSMFRHRTRREWAVIISKAACRLWRPLRLLRQAMRDDRPDVVITNTSVVLVGAAYARVARLPHIWSVKEFLDPAVKDCVGYAWLIEKLSCLVIVPSAAMAKAFSARARVLRDGNNLAAIRRGAGSSREQVLGRLGLPVGQPVIAQTGVLCWAKGQHLTGRACSLLADEGQGAGSVLFLGWGTPSKKNELREIFAGAPGGWEASVRFIEFEPDDFSYLSAADVVVHPSVLPDPYPNAVREALILGKPVIGSRVGGIPELIVDGLTGVLIEPDNPSQLAAAVKALINSPEERARIGVEAGRFADTHLDINICKDAFLEAFLSVLKH